MAVKLTRDPEQPSELARGKQRTSNFAKPHDNKVSLLDDHLKGEVQRAPPSQLVMT